MSRIVGIDLGVANSAIAVSERGEPVIIPSAEGERVTPSVVALDRVTGRLLVGTPAKRQAITNPHSTVFSVKRFVGRKFDDPTIQEDIALAPYKCTAASDGSIEIWLGNEPYSPQAILSMVLRKLKGDAETYLSESITRAVITVPAHFDDSQRRVIAGSGRLAGLDVLRIINEPSAACLAYALHHDADKTAAVYHLGGGTFDISILDVGDGVFEVISTNGDTHLGGDDFDQRIIDRLCVDFQRDCGIDLRQHKQALQRLKWAAERAKCELSTVLHTEIELPYIITDRFGSRHLRYELTRSKLEELTKDLVDRSLGCCKRALEDAGLSVNDIDDVVLTGQQTRMPAVHESVRTFFGKEPCRAIDPAEVVVLGAAVQAGVLRGDVKQVLLLDATPLTLSVETLGGVATAIIGRNTPIPTKKSQTVPLLADGNSRVEVHVVQGERPMARDNKSLGRVILDVIPFAPHSTRQIEVTLDIDANSILNVGAVDGATGQNAYITLGGSSGPDPRQVRHRREPQKQQKEAPIRSDAETLASGVESSRVDQIKGGAAMGQVQCPNCGGWDVGYDSGDPERPKGLGGKILLIVVWWAPVLSVLSLYVLDVFLGPFVGDNLALLLIGTTTGFFFLLLLVELMRRRAFIRSHPRREPKYTCRLCKYQWTQNPGEPPPEVQVRPDLIRLGRQRLDEEERRRQEEERRRQEEERRRQEAWEEEWQRQRELRRTEKRIRRDIEQGRYDR